jgi:hypothetical protein
VVPVIWWLINVYECFCLSSGWVNVVILSQAFACMEYFCVVREFLTLLSDNLYEQASGLSLVGYVSMLDVAGGTRG